MLFEQIFMDFTLLYINNILKECNIYIANTPQSSIKPLSYEVRSSPLTSSYGLITYPAGIALTMRWSAAFWYQEAVGIVARFPPNWISGDVSQMIYELINQILWKYVFGFRVK